MIPQWNKKFNNKEILKNFNINLKKRYISESKITKSFESKISKFLNVKYVLAVPSGTVALLVSLMSLGLKKNDEMWIRVELKQIGMERTFCDV